MSILKNVQIKTLKQETIKSPFTHGYCYKYRLQLVYNKKHYTFNFFGCTYDYEHGHDTVNKNEILDCLIADKCAYEDYPKLSDFVKAFGYYDELGRISYKGVDAYKGCRKTSRAFNRIFNTDEITELCTELFE